MELTRREVYTRVKAHMLKQRKRAFCKVKDRCLFRAPDGTSCAVGALIPDRLYHPSMEALTTHELIKKYPELAPHGISHKNSNLLGRLMNIHDGMPPNEWDDAFKAIEDRRELLEEPSALRSKAWKL